MEIAKNETLQHIKALTEFHGAPGFEQDLRAYIKKEMEPYADEFIYN
ncbi:peptidase M28, partial [Staphylococcus nepalensis]